MPEKEQEICRLIDQRQLDQMIWKQWVSGSIIPVGIAWMGTLDAYLVWGDDRKKLCT